MWLAEFLPLLSRYVRHEGVVSRVLTSVIAVYVRYQGMVSRVVAVYVRFKVWLTEGLPLLLRYMLGIKM